MHARASLLLAAVAVISCGPVAPVEVPPAAKPWAFVIHGGAGTIARDKLTPEREALMRAALEESLRRGHAILSEGGSALDAVTTAIVLLEDNPYFNAARDDGEEPDPARARGHGEVAARDDGRRGRRAVRGEHRDGAIDRAGNVTMTFNSPGMYRGTIGLDGVPDVMIWK